jgi:hypothetical protein
MDYQLLSRVESHAQDLFKLGQELEDDDIEDGPPTFNKRRVKRGPLLTGALPSKQAGKKSPASGFQPLTTNEELKRRAGRGDSPSTEIIVGKLPQKSKSVPFSLDTLAEDEEEHEELSSGHEPPSHAKSSPLINGRKSPAKSPKPAKDDLFQNWISMRRLPVEEQQKIHYEDLFGCFTRNFGKGFALGFGGKVLLNLFTELVSTMRSRKIHLELFTRTLDGAKDHGLFFALLLATHNSVMYMSRETKHAHARYRGAAAGFIAGLVSLSYLPPSMRRSVILFTFVRAFELACGMGVKRKILPRMENADTALMSASSAVMI